MKYTKEGIQAQIFVAFGQGSGTLRVSQEACLALSGRYGGLIDENVLAIWPDADVAPQVLERMRAIGRTAALGAALAGRTAINVDDVRQAARRVEQVSRTILCPPPDVDAKQEMELPVEVVFR